LTAVNFLKLGRIDLPRSLFLSTSLETRIAGASRRARVGLRDQGLLPFRRRKVPSRQSKILWACTHRRWSRSCRFIGS